MKSQLLKQRLSGNVAEQCKYLAELRAQLATLEADGAINMVTQWKLDIKKFMKQYPEAK